jgi:hypothetical protein
MQLGGQEIAHFQTQVYFLFTIKVFIHMLAEGVPPPGSLPPPVFLDLKIRIRSPPKNIGGAGGHGPPLKSTLRTCITLLYGFVLKTIYAGRVQYTIEPRSFVML